MAMALDTESMEAALGVVFGGCKEEITPSVTVFSVPGYYSVDGRDMRPIKAVSTTRDKAVSALFQFVAEPPQGVVFYANPDRGGMGLRPVTLSPENH